VDERYQNNCPPVRNRLYNRNGTAAVKTVRKIMTYCDPDGNLSPCSAIAGEITKKTIENTVGPITDKWNTLPITVPFF